MRLLRRRFRPALERLEDRTVLSKSIPLSTTSWTPLGPAPLNGGVPDAGRIAALATDPTNANTIYIAAAGGGVWKTTDGGTHWKALTDRQATLFMGAIALAPSNPSIIYAGTGEANLGPSKLAIARDNIYYGRGVLKSTNGGSTWTLLGNSVFDRRTISQIVVDPQDPNTVYVAVGALATNGLPGNTGIWKSTTGGATWTNTTTSISCTAAFSDLVMDPTNNMILYAGVGDPNGNSANGIWKTSDGGGSWSLLSQFPHGSTDSNVGRITIGIANTAPKTLYASIANAGPIAILYKMMKTTNGGQTWTQLTGTPNYMGQYGDYNTTLAVDPANARTVYAGGQAGGDSLIRSTDGGANWSDISTGVDFNGPHVDHHGIGFDAKGRLLDGNDGGIWRLDDPHPATLHWADLNGDLNTIQFEGIALDPTTPNIVYGGSQDNGTEKFTDNRVWNEVDGGDGGFVRDSFAQHLTVYHDAAVASFGAFAFIERSDDGGNSWFPETNGINAGSEPTIFYPPMVMDPANANRLLMGTSRVYETLNRADLWTPISTPGKNGWTASTAIDALAAAKSNQMTVYAATQGHIFVTLNDGQSWQQIDIPDFNDHIKDLAVDPHNNRHAFAVRDRFTGGPGGHVFETTNGGMSWTDISGNLPDLPANALALDTRTGLIFVGTDAGVYATNNDGTSWVSFEAGLPHVRVVGLDFNPTQNILAAATHGRGLWEVSLVHFSLTPSTTSPQAGASFDLIVTALDPFNTVEKAYRGTVHFTSTDGSAVLPANYRFTARDAGMHTFTGVVLNTPGSQTITVADTINSSVSGRTRVTVTGPLFPLSISNGSPPHGQTGTSRFPFAGTLSATSSPTLTVAYANADGTATAPDSEYPAAFVVLSPNTGGTSETTTGLANGHFLDEADETFLVNLSSRLPTVLARRFPFLSQPIKMLPRAMVRHFSGGPAGSSR
jgi:photosystem II stability/assembly factor-like uncharacterized protein